MSTPSSGHGASSHGAPSHGASSSTPGDAAPGKAHAAGAFDVRNVIAVLIGFYGAVLVVYGLVDPDQSSAKTGGVNANLWSGIVMVVVALAFFVWTRLRPIVVESVEREESGLDDGSGTAP